MREFSLQNKIGEVYRLNSLDYFLHDPEGLGFRRNASYQKIGSNYTMLSDGFEQQPISARIMLKSTQTISAYRQYAKFREFLQLIPLTLIYRTPGGEYRLDCVPESVEKTEINSVLGMDIGIVLTPLTMWYREISDYTTTNNIYIVSDSAIKSPVHISAQFGAGTYGSIEWKQYLRAVGDPSDHLISSGKLLSVTFTNAEKVLNIRTDTNPYKIYRSGNSSETNLYDKSDFSTSRFMFLEKGQNRFNLTADWLKVEGRIYYETV